MENNSGVYPLEYNVLILPKQAEKKTSGGLYIPDDIHGKDQVAQTYGVIVAVSPMAFANPDWPPHTPKPASGMKVMYARYAGASSKVTGKDGKEYILVKDNDITAVIEE